MALYVPFDVAMPRDPRMIQLGALGRLLYMECAMYCRENLTDGVINALVLPIITPDVPMARKRTLLGRMVEAGALETTANGWRIPPEVWRKWNPLRSEVEAKREAEAQRKAGYRRRAVGVSRECPNGTESDERDHATHSREQPKPEPKPKPKPEPKPEPKPLSSSNNFNGLSANRPTTTTDHRITEAIARHATIAALGKTNPTAYAATVRANDIAERGGDLQAYLNGNPTATVDDVLDVLTRWGTTTPQPDHPTWGPRNEQAARNYGTSVALEHITRNDIDPEAFRAEIAGHPEPWQTCALAAYDTTILDHKDTAA